MLSVLLLLVQSPGDQGPVYDARLRQIEVHLPRIEDATVRLDGVLDEAVWRRAALLRGFTQYRPVDSRPAADSTEVFAFYAPDAIYFGIRAYEAHGNVVRATLADRDNIDADDRIQILLDTFNDRRRALLFAVNPLGAQEDGVRSEGLAGAAGGQNAGFRFDGVVDLNPDYVYQSQGRVTLAGYEVEVRIPFKSLRYQSGATQDWGIQIIRTTQQLGLRRHLDAGRPRQRQLPHSIGDLEGPDRPAPRPGHGRESRVHVAARRGAGFAVQLPLWQHRPRDRCQCSLGHHTELERGGHGQSRFLAGRGRRRSGHRESTVRALLSRERPFFLEGLEQFRHAQRADLYAPHSFPDRRREADRQSWPHSGRVYRCRGRQRGDPSAPSHRESPALCGATSAPTRRWGSPIRTAS